MSAVQEATLGGWIAERRRAREWSQPMLAAMCAAVTTDPLVTQTDISLYESGTREPTYAKLWVLSRVFGQTPPMHAMGRLLPFLDPNLRPAA